MGYKEHQKAWLGAGYAVMFYQKLDELTQLQQQDVVILINPTILAEQFIRMNKLHNCLA